MNLAHSEAVQDIFQNEAATNRCTQLENWDMNIQPTRFGAAISINATVFVAVKGQRPET